MHQAQIFYYSIPVIALKFLTLVAWQKGPDKQCRPRLLQKKCLISTLIGCVCRVQRHTNVSKQTLMDGVDVGPPK